MNSVFGGPCLVVQSHRSFNWKRFAWWRPNNKGEICIDRGLREHSVALISSPALGICKPYYDLPCIRIEGFGSPALEPSLLR